MNTCYTCIAIIHVTVECVGSVYHIDVDLKVDGANESDHSGWLINTVQRNIALNHL